MAKNYALDRKIERILKDEHGIDASVAGLHVTGEAGFLVTSGDFRDLFVGVITREKIADMAHRIKGALH
jgi:hypothetical protein